MQWNSLSEFINMGGYGFFVWGSYGVTFILLAAELIMLRARKKRLSEKAALRRKLETRNSELETAL
ncbi:MAG TPA: heme exporter protein CcmD [Pyrinomonadaceae bacterium]|nr:heme exporter protein CcmD [Pyrinomonadaceae bacterium]